MDDNAKKPALFKLYDYTKTGTDLLDQRMARRKYTTKAKKQQMDDGGVLLFDRYGAHKFSDRSVVQQRGRST